MPHKPVIFLAFANDPDSHLDMLKNEARAIYTILQPLHDAGFIEIFREESAEISDIFDHVARFRDRLVIFHYAGHAGGTHLQLEDASANADGLAALLGNLPALQLVFLNGCSTLAQVDGLMDAGVRAVIATSVPINDNKAGEFAERYYQSLAKRATVDIAFKEATAFLQTKYENSQPTELHSYRAFKKKKESGPESDTLPWGFYMNENGVDVLSWKLPDYRKPEFPEGFGKSIKQKYNVNEYIISVLDEMVKFNPAMSSELYDRFGDPKDPRELPRIIIEHFPWPIGAQLRILIANRQSMSQPGLPRLKQILSTFTITAQFLYYMLLSQLWDEKKKHPEALSVGFSDHLIPENGGGFPATDFVPLIDKLRSLFDEWKLETFIPEFQQLFESIKNNDDVAEAFHFLHSIKQDIAKGTLADDAGEAICNEAEFCLAAILKKVAFLARYQLITVKDISVFHPRHQSATFAHQMGFLNASDQELLTEKQRDMEIFTHSHSVILVKSRDMAESLNLSPFITDRNAFEGQPIPKIYICTSKENEGYKYVFVNHNMYDAIEEPADQILTSESEYKSLHSQFESFFSELID